MPFRSHAQRRYLEANEPEIAARWAAETPKGADLPDHVQTPKKHHGVRKIHAPTVRKVKRG